MQEQFASARLGKKKGILLPGDGVTAKYGRRDDLAKALPRGVRRRFRPGHSGRGHTAEFLVEHTGICLDNGRTEFYHGKRVPVSSDQPGRV